MKFTVGSFKGKVEFKNVNSAINHRHENDFHVENKTEIGEIPISVELENMEIEMTTEEFLRAGKGISELILNLVNSPALKREVTSTTTHTSDRIDRNKKPDNKNYTK